MSCVAGISFLSKEAVKNLFLQDYTDEEISRLYVDIKNIYDAIIAKNPIQDRLAVITAGAPGSGKTFKLWQELGGELKRGKTYAYMCAEDVCLRGLTTTYIADIEAGGKSKSAVATAHQKWRLAADRATELILMHLIKLNYAFYLGSTSTAPQTTVFFQLLKDSGYTIKLIHISASGAVRRASIEKKDEYFVQTAESRVTEEALLLPQRINDTFLEFADQIEFHLREDVSADPVLAARWSKNGDSSSFAGTLQIVNATRYEKIKAIHNAAVFVLDRPELQWEATIEAQSLMI